MLESILNGISINDFVGFLFWSLIGIVFSILMEQYKFYKPIKAAGGFSIIVWFKENWRRLSIAVLAIIIGIVFQENLTGLPPSNWGSLIAAMAIDSTIDKIANRKK